ncbi:DUF4142 domain-containing protein [Nocardia terpenica]|uniref:DUF4142 domain-containing protein n=1 Tax=Nocardia terpenica TaxID=455432 RepID=A0A6G9Z7T9_9NOCA|nr:DUF4142 domain-containing protein [Nocardia terpenica]QIS21514.1 DUF4142 domain-containing protein [Nocardia terpenica]
MRTRHYVLAAMAAVALTGGTGAVGSAEPVALAGQDQQFLMAAHQGNLAEMLSGTRAALTGQGVCEAVPRIGRMLVTDHTQLDAQGAMVAVRTGTPLPLTPTPDQTQQLLATGMKTGRDFDIAWLQMQQRFHTETLAAVRQEIAGGASDEVQTLARQAEPVVLQHLSAVQEALTVC